MKDLLTIPKTKVEVNNSVAFISSFILSTLLYLFYFFVVAVKHKSFLNEVISGFLNSYALIGFISISISYFFFKMINLHRKYEKYLVKWTENHDEYVLSCLRGINSNQAVIDKINLTPKKQIMQKLFYDFVGDSVKDDKVEYLRTKFYEKALSVWIFVALEVIIIFMISVNIAYAFLVYFGRDHGSVPYIWYILIVLFLFLISLVSRMQIQKELKDITNDQIDYIKVVKNLDFERVALSL